MIESMIKFVIWGNGRRGKVLFDILGAERVELFIDNNAVSIGGSYKNVPVLTYEQYRENKCEFPIFITPRGHEYEILDQMCDQDRELSFLFENEYEDLLGILSQASITQLVKDISNNLTVSVYGKSGLSLIIYDTFCNNQKSVNYVFPDNIPSDQKERFAKLFKLKIKNILELKKDTDYIVLGEDLFEDDKKKITDLEIAYENWRKIGLHKDLFWNKQIKKFKNIHKGKRCFIVATGPSLTVDDINTLYEHQEICISMNGIKHIFDETEWRPDYYIVSDRIYTILWQKEIVQMNVKHKFIADCAWNFGELNEMNIYKFHLQREPFDDCLPQFSSDFSKQAYWGMTVTYEGALQLAVYMGFDEIYLLGTDCSKSKEYRHFRDTSETKTILPNELQRNAMLRAYTAARQYAEQNGIKIYNATRGGELEVFQRVEFDDLFERDV